MDGVNDRDRVQVRLWTSAVQNKVVHVGIDPHISTIGDLRNVIVASGYAQSPDDIYMWTEHGTNNTNNTNNDVKVSSSVVDQYLELPFLDMVTSQLSTNLRVSPDSRFVSEDSNVAMNILSDVLQTFFKVPMNKKNERGKSKVKSNGNKSKEINVNDDDSIRRYMLERFMSLTDLQNQITLRRVGRRYILNATDSEVVPDVPHIFPFFSSASLHNTTISNKIHVSNSPYEYELISDAILGAKFIEFTTSEYVKANKKELHPFYFPVSLSSTSQSSSSLTIKPFRNTLRNVHPTIQVLSARAFSMSVPIIPSAFAPDFLYQVFAILNNGPVFYHLVNKDDSYQDRYKLDKRYLSIVSRSVVRKWINATPPNIQKPALHLYIPLIDKSIEGMAVVTLDRHFRQHLQIKFPVIGPMRAINDNAIANATKRVQELCIDPINIILRSLDAPIRIHTISTLLLPSLSYASSHMRWLETHYTVSSSKKPRVDDRSDILPHISGNMYIYRHVSGFRDPRVVNKMTEILVYSGASHRHACDLMHEWFGVSLEEADKLLNLVPSTMGNGRPPGTNNILLHAPVITVQNNAHVKGVYISPYALKNIINVLFSQPNAAAQKGGGSSANNIINNIANDVIAEHGTFDRVQTTHHQKTPKGYLLDRMYRADPELFAGTTYATTCGFVDGRQPVVISEEKQKSIDKKYPDSYGGVSIPYGSSEEKASKNRYICPDIWCPVSEVSMTLAQLEAAGGKCPLPDEETPEHYNKTDYFDGESRHIGFLDPSKHPKGLCLPCCFRKPGKRIDRCISSSSSSSQGNNNSVQVSPTKEEKARYVMHFDVVPLPAPGRMGVMPLDLTHAKDVVRLASSRAPTDTSFSQCIKDILGISELGKIVERMDRFLALGDGFVCSQYMHASDPLRILQDADLFKQFLSVVSEKGEYAQKFGLTRILTPYLATTKKKRESLLSDYESMKRSPEQTSLIRELMIFGAHDRFIKKKDAFTLQEQDAIIDLINETNDFGIGIILIRYDGVNNSVRKVKSPSQPSTIMLSYTSRNVCERVVVSNANDIALTSTPFYRGLVSKVWTLDSRGVIKKKKNHHRILTHSSGVTVSDILDSTLTLSYESDTSPYPDLQFEVDTRAFPVSADEVARTSSSMHREEMRRKLATTIRSDFYLLTEVNHLRAIATRPPKNLANAYKDAIRIVKKAIGTKKNEQHVDWLAMQLLLAEEPLMIRYDIDIEAMQDQDAHIIIFDEQMFDDVLPIV